MEEALLRNEERILRSIFPDLVRLLILQKLDDFPSASANIYNASVFLQQLLRPRRTLFFFAQVLERSVSLQSKVSLKIRLDNNKTLYDSPLTNQVFLNLRLVCKSWCVALDKLVQSKTTYHSMHTITKVSDHGEGDIEAKFLTHFENSHLQNLVPKRSPFIGNAVILEWRDSGIDRPFNPETRPFAKLLRKYGHHLEDCWLTLRQAEALEGWYHATAVQILRSLPNVQDLTLSLSENLDFWNNNSAADFNWLTCLPELVHLKTLSLKSGLSHKFLSGLVPKLPNITTLEPSLSKSLGHTPNLFPDASLRSLKILDFKSPFRTTDLRPVLPNSTCAASIALHNIFQALEHHSPMQNLTMLSIDIPCVLASTWNDWQHYRVNLPKLCFLNLRLSNWSCIDFALMFRNTLRYLEVKMSTSETLEEWSHSAGADRLMRSERIQFLTRNGTFDKNSNIWTLMPHLKSADAWISKY